MCSMPKRKRRYAKVPLYSKSEQQGFLQADDEDTFDLDETDDTEVDSPSEVKREKNYHTSAAVCQRKFCFPIIAASILAGAAIGVVLVVTSSEKGNPSTVLKWWQKCIVYQIYPRSFKDSNGDGVGDLKGITSKLDYFTYLNVKAIWISPFYPSPMADFGYDISNYTDVDPLFGSLSDFDVLLQEAHKRGLRVIIDFVAGHTSSAHPWFNMSVQRIPLYDEYYIWADGTVLENGSVIPPSNWVSRFGYSAWQWNDVRQQYYYHAYLASQPTLNYRSPEVLEEVKNVLRFWLDRGVDGIRVDAVSNMMVHSDYYQNQARSYKEGAEWWQKEYYIMNLTHNVPDIFPIVGEWRKVLNSYHDFDADTDDYKLMIVEVVDGPDGRNRYFHSGADLPFNFDLIFALNMERKKECNASCIRGVIQRGYDSLATNAWANFVFSSHDEHRASSRIGVNYVDAMNVLLLTLQGTPTTYYGEELGMKDITVSFEDTQDPKGKRLGPKKYKKKSRDPERSPMQWDDSMNAGFTTSSKPWLPVHPEYKTINVEVEMNSPKTTSLKVYRDAAFLREQPSLQYGALDFCVVTPNILSFIRSANAHPNYLIIINFGKVNETVSFSKPVETQDALGLVKVITSRAANEGRFVKDAFVSLTSVTLYPGDGLVMEVEQWTCHTD
ncbi:hypothetical protein BaRGS_00026257 [Batillaria attramentaria]|uniref:Glycosyl hydrolase family 13 catalytic domain-containing protein n=1 Tax=Batillaria attramentaria TaxID=370345 RepID=A0ABD0K6F4_9CAEN